MYSYVLFNEIFDYRLSLSVDKLTIELSEESLADFIMMFIFLEIYF